MAFPKEPEAVDHPEPESSEARAEIRKIKARVRQAMQKLEDGKHVAAFNLLKALVED